MYITATDFRQNIGRYLELCEKEDIFIMKHGESFAKLSGVKNGRRESVRRITGSLTIGSSENDFEETDRKSVV